MERLKFGVAIFCVVLLSELVFLFVITSAATGFDWSTSAALAFSMVFAGQKILRDRPRPSRDCGFFKFGGSGIPVACSGLPRSMLVGTSYGTHGSAHTVYEYTITKYCPHHVDRIITLRCSFCDAHHCFVVVRYIDRFLLCFHRKAVPMIITCYHHHHRCHESYSSRFPRAALPVPY